MNSRVWRNLLIALLAISPAIAEDEDGRRPVQDVVTARRHLLEQSTHPLVAHRFEKPFYLVANGPFDWFDPQSVEALKQTGLEHELVQGYLSLRHLDPEANVPTIYRALAARFLRYRWPFLTIDYDLTRGEPLAPPPPPGLARDLWLGSSHPEELYRLEPFFYYVREGRRWPGSSMGHWTDEGFRKFMEERVLPRVRRELPFYADPNHRWTRAQLKRLTELLTEAYWEERIPVVWHMNLSQYYQVARSDVRAIGTKGCSAYELALARGMLRHAAGKAAYMVWLGFEPTRRYYVHPFVRGGLDHNRGGAIGLPKQLIELYYLKPYFSGATCVKPENVPGGCFTDIERDGQFELSPVGRAIHRVLDLAHRYPDRGTAWVPIALLLDREREIGLGGSTYGVPVGLSRLWAVPYDEADQFNHGLVWDTLFPEPPAARWTGGYFRTAPYGELFAIIKPNERLRRGLTARNLLEPFAVAFALGGLQLDHALTETLTDFVRSGGTLLVHAPDVLNAADSLQWRAMTGVALHAELRTGQEVVDSRTQKRWYEEPFQYHRAEPLGARVLYACEGQPLVTVNRYGAGQVIVLCTRYAIQISSVPPLSGFLPLRRYWKQRPVLKLVGELLGELVKAATPLRVEVPSAARPYIGWEVRRRGTNWLAVVYNYDVRQQPSYEPRGIAHSYAKPAPVRTPLRLIHENASYRHVLEWLSDTTLQTQRTREGTSVLSHRIAAGGVHVYEFSTAPITPAPPRWQNLALGKPARASSALDGFGPELAVDGRHDWDRYWCSAQSHPTTRNTPWFSLPQWLEVDLERVHRINHTRVYLHWEPDDDLDSPPKIYRYRIEVSRDGQQWQTVVNETQNLNPARPHGHWRWFEPVDARYVRLVITDNLIDTGARVVELEVYDADTPGLAEPEPSGGR